MIAYFTQQGWVEAPKQFPTSHKLKFMLPVVDRNFAVVAAGCQDELQDRKGSQQQAQPRMSMNSKAKHGKPKEGHS